MRYSRRNMFTILAGMVSVIGLPVQARPVSRHFDQDDYTVVFVGDAHAEYVKMVVRAARESKADRILVSPTILTVMQSGAHAQPRFQREPTRQVFQSYGRHNLFSTDPHGPIDQHIGHLVDGGKTWPVDIDVYLGDASPTTLLRSGEVVGTITHSVTSLRFV